MRTQRFASFFTMAALATAFAGTVFATPGSGVLSSTVWARAAFRVPVEVSHATRSAAHDAATPPDPHVRFEDARPRRLLLEAIPRSPTLRRLIERLNDSDVVVYIRCERLRAGVVGRLSFVSTADGIRYLKVGAGCVGDRQRQAAVMGHELQHAVEIADRPTIVDTASMQSEYERIGYVNHFASTAGIISFETDLALRVGEQIFRELRNDSE